jgi:3-oxoadipate enol-lactonase
MVDLSFFTTGDGCRLAYRLDGPDGAPVIVLANSIGTTLRMWDGQILELVTRYRVLRYDLRGHGASDVPAGGYSFDRLGRDVVELLDALAIDTIAFCGLSLGGFIGQWLGIHRPERIERLVLANTSSYVGPAPPWDQQINAILAASDTTAITETFLANWFPPRMLDPADKRVAPFRDDLLNMDQRGLAGCLAAVRDADMRRTISLIAAPTLVITGAHDLVTLPQHGELIARTVPGAQLVTFSSVHLSNVEQPDEFLKVLFTFLDDYGGRTDQGSVRRGLSH